MSNRPPAASIAAGFALLVLGGCVSNSTPDADGSLEQVAETTPISVTIPPERVTPFCAAMIDLTERVADPDADVKALITETYRSILADVPAEIATDFEAVLTELETGVPAPTELPVTQPELPPSTAVASDGSTPTVPDDTTEYFFPATTSAQRVNDYVAFACRDSENNPGPSATAPTGVEGSDDE